MNKGRLEAFSDGVLAIIITIMVLEMKAPDHTNIASLLPSVPVLISYVLSFVYVGIYWINHHNIIQSADKINGRILWANLNLLFWLSLIPFTTSWVGENHIDSIPMAFYGGALLMCSVAYKILEMSLVKYAPTQELLAKAEKSRRRELVSAAVYFAAIPLAFVNVYVSALCYLFIAVIWVLPSFERDGGAPSKGPL